MQSQTQAKQNITENGHMHNRPDVKIYQSI